MRNAEAALRDDVRLITQHVFAAGSLPGDRFTIAVSREPYPLHEAIAERLGAELGHPAVVVEETDDHEIYLQRPAVLADWLRDHLGAVAPYNSISTYGS